MMNILYAVQATGNGHISRARELLPVLQQMGNVDIFLSGSHCHLDAGIPVKYRSSGVSLFPDNKGGLAYGRILRGIKPFSLVKTIRDLPVEKYDLVINDYEFVTAAACARKNIPSVQLGHQASFHSPLAPRPRKKEWLGEWVLEHYAATSHYLGLHFEEYDDFILHPVIKQEIRDADPVNLGHITVYLPGYSASHLANYFGRFPGHLFHIFSKEQETISSLNNITFYPIHHSLFNRSLVSSSGLICGAGFETPAEAMYLGKRMICIPARGQYEQHCNAAALQRLGVRIAERLDDRFFELFTVWINDEMPERKLYADVKPLIAGKLMALYQDMRDKRLPAEKFNRFSFT